MGTLILYLVDVHLTQLFFMKHWFCVSYSSGYMQQIGLFCRSQNRQTLATLSILFYTLHPFYKEVNVLTTIIIIIIIRIE